MGNASAPSNFPERLFVLLEESGDKGFGNVIRWLPDGNGFQVLSREMMEETVIPQYFGAATWKSFQRQLNLYGFRSIKDPISKERYFHHPHFRRDQQHQLCSTIKRQKTTSDADAVTATDASSSAPTSSQSSKKKKKSPASPVLSSSTLIAKSTTQPQKPEKYRITAATVPATTTKALAQHRFYPHVEQQDHRHRQQHDDSTGGNHDENPVIGENQQERKMTPPVDNSARQQEFTKNDIIQEIITTFATRS